MITQEKFNKIKDDLMKAIQEIEKKQDVKFALDKTTLAYNKGQLTFSFVESKVDEYEDRRLKAICQSIGFTQNVMGLTFDFRGDKYEICGIKKQNRKYPVIANNVRTGISYKFSVDTVKSRFGGDKLINRTKNLDQLIDGIIT